MTTFEWVSLLVLFVFEVAQHFRTRRGFDRGYDHGLELAEMEARSVVRHGGAANDTYQAILRLQRDTEDRRAAGLPR